MTTSSAGAVYLVAGNISFCGQCDVIPPTKQAFITWPQKGLKGIDTLTGREAMGLWAVVCPERSIVSSDCLPKAWCLGTVDKHLGDIWWRERNRWNPGRWFWSLISMQSDSISLPLSTAVSILQRRRGFYAGIEWDHVSDILFFQCKHHFFLQGSYSTWDTWQLCVLLFECVKYSFGFWK